MSHQHRVPAVNRYKKFWMSFSVKPLYIFLVAVAGSVDKVFTSCAITNNADTLPCQAVFHFLHLKFVARNNRSRENYCISFMERKFCVGFIGSAIKRGKFFTLSPGH